jgi:hypothetical protein
VKETGLLHFNLQLDIGPLELGLLIFIAYLVIVYMTGTILGGNGSIAQLAFLSAAYTAPLILLSGLLQGISSLFVAGGLPPVDSQPGLQFANPVLPDSQAWFLGRSVLLTLLLIGFTYVAVRAVHRLQASKAFLVVLAPTVLVTWATLGLMRFFP